MCLEVYAVPATDKRVSAERLSTVSGLRVEKRRRPADGSLIFSKDGGCSCSLMAESADWNNPVWALEPGILEGLVRAIKLLGEETRAFTFQAIWIGDKPESEERVPLKTLLSDIRNNRVKNKHVYIIGNVAG